MNCKICYTKHKENEWLKTARVYSARNYTDEPERCLKKNLTDWRPIDELNGIPGRNHKYRCPECKTEHCLESDCEHKGDWIKNSQGVIDE